MGKDIPGCEVIENYDLGAGPVHVAWIFKPGSESLPDLRPIISAICRLTSIQRKRAKVRKED